MKTTYDKSYNTKGARIEVRTNQATRDRIKKTADKYNLSVSKYLTECALAETQSRTMREKKTVQSLAVIQTQVNEALKLCKEDSDLNSSLRIAEEELNELWHILSMRKKTNG